MKHCTATGNTGSPRQRLHEHSQGRFPDWHNLPKPTWRDALKALAAPATRVHRYRNLRTAIVHEVTSTLDSKDCT